MSRETIIPVDQLRKLITEQENATLFNRLSGSKKFRVALKDNQGALIDHARHHKQLAAYLILRHFINLDLAKEEQLPLPDMETIHTSAIETPDNSIIQLQFSDADTDKATIHPCCEKTETLVFFLPNSGAKKLTTHNSDFTLSLGLLADQLVRTKGPFLGIPSIPELPTHERLLQPEPLTNLQYTAPHLVCYPAFGNFTLQKLVKRYSQAEASEPQWIWLICEFMDATMAIHHLHKHDYCHGEVSLDTFYMHQGKLVTTSYNITNSVLTEDKDLTDLNAFCNLLRAFKDLIALEHAAAHELLDKMLGIKKPTPSLAASGSSKSCFDAEPTGTLPPIKSATPPAISARLFVSPTSPANIRRRHSPSSTKEQRNSPYRHSAAPITVERHWGPKSKSPPKKAVPTARSPTVSAMAALARSKAAKPKPVSKPSDRRPRR